MAEAIPDRRVRGLIFARVSELAAAPEQMGKPLTGELAGYRTIRAAGQRYRIVYRVERRQVTILVVAVGRRKEGERQDVYELARRLLRQRLLEG
jgi:mRNA interferase RelE/StbE